MINKKIKSRYSTKLVNSKFYSVVEANNKEMTGEPKMLTVEQFNNGEQGCVFVPYILTIRSEGELPSPEYTAFMDKYKKEHALCPKCGSKVHNTTLMCYVFRFDRPEEYKDLNRCTCIVCGNVHTKHDRVEEVNNG